MADIAKIQETANKTEGYFLTTFNGNAGDLDAFDTLEDAIREMDFRWSHLTDNERIACIEGGWFDVYYGTEDDDNWTAIESKTEEVKLVINTPKGLRYIEAYDLVDVWTSLRYYDKCHRTNLRNDLEMDDILFDTPVDGIEPFDHSDMEPRIEEWSGTVKITAHGNSLDIKVTEAARAMDLQRGDYVEISIRKSPKK